MLSHFQPLSQKKKQQNQNSKEKKSAPGPQSRQRGGGRRWSRSPRSSPSASAARPPGTTVRFASVPGSA
eukprot:2893482-Rhodomonas_salina.2